MFDSSDVQSVFSGNIAEEWEKKSRYINSLNGNDNMMIPTIKKYITSTSKILEVGCGTGKLLSQIDALTFGIELTGVEMSSDMLQQIDTLRFKNPVRLINDSVENFIDDNKYDIIVMKQVLYHVQNQPMINIRRSPKVNRLIISYCIKRASFEKISWLLKSKWSHYYNDTK